MKARLFVVIALFWMAVSASLIPAEFREFRDSNGNAVEARLVGLIGNEAEIELRDGRRVKLPITRFSADDRAYIRSSAPAPPPKLPANQKGVFTMRNRIEFDANRVAFTPDGKFLIAAGSKTVKLNAETGEVVWESTTASASMGLSADGKVLGLLDFRTRKTVVLDATTGQLLVTVPAAGRDNNARKDIAISQKGDLLAVATGADYNAEISSLPDGKFLTVIETEGRVESVAFSPDGRTLAVSPAVFMGFALFDTAGFRTIREFKRDERDGRIDTHLTFSPDGRYLAAHKGSSGPDAEIWVWEVGSGQNVFKTQAHVLAGSLAFAPNGRWLASTVNMGGSAGGVRIWEFASGKEVATVSLPDQSGKNAFGFSPDGRLLAVSCNAKGGNGIVIWEIE